MEDKRKVAVMKAMVLAAGKGTRLMPLTGELPKPMAPVAGKPILQHIFELLSEANVDEVNVNVHHLADAILDYYGQECWLNGMMVNINPEERLLGTAGGARRLARHFKETFVVIMGDALTDVDLGELLDFHRERGAVATLALMRVSETSHYGVVELDPAGNVTGFQEKPSSEEAISNLANTGIYVLEPEALSYIPEDTFFDFAEDVFPRLLDAGEKFVGYEGDFYWSDIGTLDAYRQAQKDALSGRVKVKIPGTSRGDGLWVDQRARLDPSAAFRGRIVIRPDAIIERGVELTGDLTVGRGCRVRRGATIKRSVLFPGCSVGRGAYLEGCIVGPGYKVRPGEKVRDKTLVCSER